MAVAGGNGNPMSSLFGGLILALLFVGQTAVAVAQPDTEPVISLSGSGTTNPSKLLWRIFDTIEQQAGTPVRLTYRAVGSGTGIAEFIGDAPSGFNPYSNFGSADVPLPLAEYQKLQAQGMSVLQIPFVLGAVSVFATVQTGAGKAASVNSLRSPLVVRVCSHRHDSCFCLLWLSTCT